MLTLKPLLPLGLERRLAPRKERPRRVAHEREHTPRITRAVADLVEPLQGANRPLVRAIAALSVRVSGAPVGQGAHDLDAAIGEVGGEVFVAGQEQHREVAPVDDVFAPVEARVDQAPEVRVQLRRAAREVHGVRLGAVERRQTGVHGVGVHLLTGPVRPRVDMAMPTGHVAELAEVHLEVLEPRRTQHIEPRRGDPRVEVEGGDGQGIEHPELLGRSGQREAAPCERGRALRTRVEALQVGIDEPHMPFLRTCSSIWVPCTSEAPPRIAQATCTASVICSRSAPFSRASFE